MMQVMEDNEIINEPKMGGPEIDDPPLRTEEEDFKFLMTVPWTDKSRAAVYRKYAPRARVGEKYFVSDRKKMLVLGFGLCQGVLKCVAMDEHLVVFTLEEECVPDVD